MYSEGWRSGVILRELENEVEIHNSMKFRESLAEFQEVDRLLRLCQLNTGKGESRAVQLLREHRTLLRQGK